MSGELRNAWGNKPGGVIYEWRQLLNDIRRHWSLTVLHWGQRLSRWLWP